MTDLLNGATIVFAPLLGWPVVWVLAGGAALAVALALWRGLPGWWLRGLGLGAVVLALAGPAVQIEDRAPLGDIALILSDASGSNRLAGRDAQTDAAQAHLAARLAALGIETRTASLSDGADNSGSAIGAALGAALADIPGDRLAGVFVVSDGLAHDAMPVTDAGAPVHLVQTGRPGDWDRRMVLRTVPAYAILGESLTLTLRIDDAGAVPAALRDRPAMVTFSLNGDAPRTALAPVGQDLELSLTLDQAGQNVLHFVVEGAEGELTDRNNAAVVQITGVRDRLRVLLVSGEPHTGQRTWRNLLKSDPAVDLVHFTILRPPNRQDGVPVQELSLIAFPTRELFIEKIDEFDLIIFDRYRRRGILPNAYFDNIARYVEQGGALLVVGGPELAGAESIHFSPLGRVFPALPTTRLFERAYTPRVSDLGARHPVTAGLAQGWPVDGDGVPGWGRWLRQIDLTPQRGTIAMEGVEGRPLLVLDRVGEGRVALLASDQAWLWDRGFEGGGPQAELLRRLAHWLMSEPELEEESLTATADGARLAIDRRSLGDGPHVVTVTAPDGVEQQVTLDARGAGRFTAMLDAPEPGIWRLRDDPLEAVVVQGTANPREYENVLANASALLPLITPSRGGVALVVDGLPDLRAVAAGRQAHGRGWLGVTPRAAHVVADLRLMPLLPAWAWLLLGAGLMLAAWLREGRR